MGLIVFYGAARVVSIAFAAIPSSYSAASGTSLVQVAFLTIVAGTNEEKLTRAETEKLNEAFKNMAPEVKDFARLMMSEHHALRVQGQQLAKQLFLTPEKSWRRKINEMFLAIEIESAEPTGSWAEETSVPGYTGESYFRWAGPNHFTQPGNGTFGFDFEIHTGGTYWFRIRNHHHDVDIVIAHARRVYVAPGDRVRVGQLIARASDDGAPDGCHLHFEVRPHGGGHSSAVRPHDLLRLRR